MDSWVNGESLFTSRKLGSAVGVVQVYRCWSLDAPVGDDSFSLIGETSSPSEIAPGTVWEQKDYLRLIEFLEVNSAMVNVRGHVILRSLVKSLRVGRPDGPVTYWRCLDVLPMHAFGLVRPVDTHGAPQFLIVGGDVLADSVTPGEVITDAGEWRCKYDNLDAEFDKLKLEVSTLKDTLAGVNAALTESQTENLKLEREIEDQKSTNKQVEGHVRDIDGERQKASKEVEELKIEVADLRMQVTQSISEVERDHWALSLANNCLVAWNSESLPQNPFVSLEALTSKYRVHLTDYRRAGSFICKGTWIVYRDSNIVTVESVDIMDYGNSRYWYQGSLWWEIGSQPRKLVGLMCLEKN